MQSPFFESAGWTLRKRIPATRGFFFTSHGCGISSPEATARISYTRINGMTLGERLDFEE